MSEPAWKVFPLVDRTSHARAWLKIVSDLGRSENTVQAYGRNLEGYLSFCRMSEIKPEDASRADIALFVRYLFSRRSLRSSRGRQPESEQTGLSNATIQQHLTAVRLFYEYLVEEGLREDNPVGRGRYTPGNSFGGQRGLIRRYQKLPWIPSDEQWLKLVEAMREESSRNRLMLAFAYDAALRREELCALQIDDIDPAQRLLRIRAESTKGRQERIVPYSEPTGEVYKSYLRERRVLSRAPGLLFLSKSRRNRGKPLTIWTWSKVTKALAGHSGVEGFTTHTPRHLCLTDLARAGWGIHEIARFAGHKDTATTLQYIHLSGRDLASKLGRGMAQIHSWRVHSIASQDEGIGGGGIAEESS